MKITRKHLIRIIKEELLREQYQPHEPGIRTDEDGLARSYGRRVADNVYMHDNVDRDGSKYFESPGAMTGVPDAVLILTGSGTERIRPEPTPKPEPMPEPASDPSPTPEPEPETQTQYQPRSWTDDESVTKSSIKSRWFPKFAKTDTTSSPNGSYVDLVDNDGDGPWYVTPGMGGLDQSHFDRDGWVWWKMTKKGIYYTPKKPGGRVGDWDDSGDSDIAYAPMEISADLPGGYSIKNFNLDNMFYRFGGKTGLGLEGDINLVGSGLRPDVSRSNRQMNQLTDWGTLRTFLSRLFRTGSSSLTLNIDTTIGDVPITLSVG